MSERSAYASSVLTCPSFDGDTGTVSHRSQTYPPSCWVTYNPYPRKSPQVEAGAVVFPT